MISYKRLKQLFYYDNRLGMLVRRHTQGGVLAGTPVSNKGNQNGLVQVKIDGRSYCLHKLVWFYHKKKYPKGEIDHKDTNRAHNNIENLRSATGSNNCANQNRRKNNRCGFKGVHRRETGKYRASITKNYKSYRLGQFSTPEEAHTAYKKKAVELFGQFARS